MFPIASTVIASCLTLMLYCSLTACSERDQAAASDGANNAVISSDAGTALCSEPMELLVDRHFLEDGGIFAGSGGRQCVWSIPAPLATEHRAQLTLDTQDAPGGWSRNTTRVTDESACTANGHMEFYLEDGDSESTLALCPAWCGWFGKTQTHLRIARSCTP